MRSRRIVLAHLVAAAAFALAPLFAVAQPAPETAPAAASAPAASVPAVATSAATAPAPAVTAPVRPQPVPASPLAGPSAGNLLQTIFALTLVLGVLFGLAWFMKRYGPKASGGSANLRIVGALNLGGRERIMVVEVGEQWIVVGASPGRINALATMPRQEAAPGSAPATLSEHLPPVSSFSEWLKQTIDKRNAK